MNRAERRILFTNAALLDAAAPHRREGGALLVEGGVIKEVAERPIKASAELVLDLKGRTLMPGLIDAHVHIMASSANLSAVAALPPELAVLRAVPILSGMLERGFTTVRDLGGADYAWVEAFSQQGFRGPRLIVCGKSLTQTGGHADLRGRFEQRRVLAGRTPGALGRIADGVDAVRRAAREELRAGAHYIKVMAGGGIASPTDPIGNLQYSPQELAAAVEEATAWHTYVAAHVYTVAQIRRCVEAGVKTFEHCNLIDLATAELIAARGGWIVPTLVTYEALAEEGASLGLPAASVAKIEDVRRAGLASLELFKAAGNKLAYGTDLLGPMHRHQSRELRLRAEVFSPFEILCQATANAAELIGWKGRLGTLAPGAVADLLVVDGDPLQDLSVLEGQGERLSVIVQEGRVLKNRLT